MPDIRDIERRSIRDFVTTAAEGGYLSGHVLDFGCGDQPYRDIVEVAGGAYDPFDLLLDPDDDWELRGPFDTILCTQVIEYLFEPQLTLQHFRDNLRPQGWLVMTGPTNWPVVEGNDLWRFTPNGIRVLLARAGFAMTVVTDRPSFEYGGDSRWCLGWGVIARA